jgi:signal recognition particle receptor subunit beta
LNKINPANIPIVVQYNKRDLADAADVDYLEYVINNNEVHFPYFEAVASTGYGVLETLNAIARLLMIKYSKPASNDSGSAPQTSSYAA